MAFWCFYKPSQCIGTEGSAAGHLANKVELRRVPAAEPGKTTIRYRVGEPTLLLRAGIRHRRFRPCRRSTQPFGWEAVNGPVPKVLPIRRGGLTCRIS